jgi:hypothetical protein
VFLCSYSWVKVFQYSYSSWISYSLSVDASDISVSTPVQDVSIFVQLVKMIYCIPTAGEDNLQYTYPAAGEEYPLFLHWWRYPVFLQLVKISYIIFLQLVKISYMYSCTWWKCFYIPAAGEDILCSCSQWRCPIFLQLVIKYPIFLYWWRKFYIPAAGEDFLHIFLHLIMGI